MEISSFFLLVRMPGVRTSNIGSLKGVQVYRFTLRNMQYIEVESNCPGVSNKE